MKISEILQQGTKTLKAAGCGSANLDAIILLQKVLQKPKEFMITHSENEITPDQQRQFLALVARRANHEPVAYITGKKQFYGREFTVSSDVLTPRPETEILVEAALKLFPENPKINILDLGTGSGCIILTLLAEFRRATGFAVDISKSALAIAKINAYNLGIANVEFVQSDWCENLDLQREYQLLVSNPPYIPRLEAKTLPPELNYEPDAALFGGDDGLECYKRLAKEISAIKFNFAVFEIGIGQELEIEKIFDEYQIKLKQTVADLAGIPRVMIFQKH